MPTLAFFFAGCTCCSDFPCPTYYIFVDEFTRSDSTDIGADWTEVAGDWSIASNKLRISSANALALCDVFDASLPNHPMSVVFRMSANGDKARVIVNYTDSSNYDFVEFQLGATTSTMRLYTRVGGSNTQISVEYESTAGTSPTTGDDITMEICAHANYISANATWGAAGLFAASRTTNTGNQAAVATGDTVTGNVDFDSFKFYGFDTEGIDGYDAEAVLNPDCPRCFGGCASCNDEHSPSAYEVVLTGMSCGSCNATFVVYGLWAGVTYGACMHLLEFPCDIYDYLFISTNGNTFPSNASGAFDGVGVALQTLSGHGNTWSKDYTYPIDEDTDGYGDCFFEDLVLAYLGDSGTPPCTASGTATVTAL